MTPEAPGAVALMAGHTRLHMLELGRNPAFAVPVLVLPALFYLLFGVSTQPRLATPVLVSFCAFAVLGVVLFQFGVGVAAERESPWERYVRTLPIGAGPRIAARIVTAVGFAAAACLPVVAAGALASAAPVRSLPWAGIAGVLLLGALPFGLLGIGLGYVVDPRAAVPATNLVYLILAYAGGLFRPPAHLPGILQTLAGLLPTGQWRNLLTGVAAGTGWDAGAAGGLLLWTVVFGVAAAAGYRRDEGLQYR